MWAIYKGDEIVTSQEQFISYRQCAVFLTKEEALDAYNGAEFYAKDGYHIREIEVISKKGN